MKVVYEKLASLGEVLSNVPFGCVVRRADARAEDTTTYLVVSMMDGTGERTLVTLGSGVLKKVQQHLRVVVLIAEVRVRGVCEQFRPEDLD